MSRSYRRPFAAVTGTASAKEDKRMAHRGVRRKQKLALNACNDYEELLIPHYYECSWNNTYCWGRDGKQTDRAWLRHELDNRSQKYYRKLLRK